MTIERRGRSALDAFIRTPLDALGLGEPEVNVAYSGDVSVTPGPVTNDRNRFVDVAPICARDIQNSNFNTDPGARTDRLNFVLVPDDTQNLATLADVLQWKIVGVDSGTEFVIKDYAEQFLCENIQHTGYEFSARWASIAGKQLVEPIGPGFSGFYPDQDFRIHHFDAPSPRWFDLILLWNDPAPRPAFNLNEAVTIEVAP